MFCNFILLVHGYDRPNNYCHFTRNPLTQELYVRIDCTQTPICLPACRIHKYLGGFPHICKKNNKVWSFGSYVHLYILLIIAYNLIEGEFYHNCNWLILNVDLFNAGILCIFIIFMIFTIIYMHDFTEHN